MSTKNKNINLLTTDSLSIGYPGSKGKVVLQENLSLQLHEGDLVCLLGPNGCGKSTLIRTLSGIQEALGGSVCILGENLKRLKGKQRSELMNTVLTDRTVVDQISVEEIVSLGRYNYTNWLGSLSTADEEIVKESIAKVGLTDHTSSAFSTLSDGEKQRSFIAKALASNAPLLILDEPTAHLDLPNRVEILSLLRNLTRESGHAVLVSTHDLDLALQLADEIWLMLPNQLMICGTPEEITSGNYLDKAFGNDSLYFDKKSGGFALRKRAKFRIELEGNSPELKIGLLAFNRLGYALDGPGNSIAKLYLEEGKWVLQATGEVIKNLSLSEVCRILRIMNPKN